MKEKKTAGAAIVFCALLYGIFLLDLFGEERYFSPNENRILAQKPVFERSAFLDGSFARKYEEYVSDQFTGRDAWIRAKACAELLTGSREVNGVYVLGDGLLIESHQETGQERAVEKLKELKEDASAYESLSSVEDVKVLLAPTAGAVYREKLPAHAPEFDQYEFLDRAGAALGTKLVDVRGALEKRRQEGIYYRTDHHWTTLGAYCAYTQWALAEGITPVPEEAFQKVRVSDSFLGTLHSKINIPVRPDTIELFLPKGERNYQVFYDLREEPEASLYQKKYLETKNQYGVFLDDNHGLVEIRTNPARERPSGEKSGKRLLVIKDSYANCFVPFLTEHYDTVFMLDKRYYRGSEEAMIEENKITDIIILYDVMHFIENY